MDPFDGGPHFGCPAKECSLVKNVKKMKWGGEASKGYPLSGLVGVERDSEFESVWASFAVKKDKIFFPKKVSEILGLEDGEKVAVTNYQPIDKE